MFAPRRFARHAALAYATVVVYASLHPFSGWRDLGVAPWDFLFAAWPRYWTGVDLLLNVLAYLPLGFLLAQALCRNTHPGLPAAICATLLGSLLSLGVEVTQNWLPSRVPSNVDLACNAVGALCGAVLAWRSRFWPELLSRPRSWLGQQPHLDIGLLLAFLWLLAQLSPETLPFASGDLRHLLPLQPAVPFAAPLFRFAETLLVATNILAVGLFARTLLADRWQALPALLLFFIAALLVKTLSAALLLGPDNALQWATPATLQGLGYGLAALLLCLPLPTGVRLALLGLALLIGSVLVNLAPANPYSQAALATWYQGHFLNFNGLTRLTAALWPFLVLPYLLLYGRKQ
jgi:VanZ family protein